MPDRKSRELKLLCPNGHLGFAPLRQESFLRGVDELPDTIVADSGSSDVGPAPLALDRSTSPRTWQRADLEAMLLAARRLEVPMIVGSAGDSGSNSRVDLYVELIEDLAREHRLAPFRLGYFYSEVPRAKLSDRLRAGEVVRGLDGRPPLRQEDLDATERVVAVAGVHPIMSLLDDGADVVIAGRCSDAAIFAAPAIRAGFPVALSYHLGKLLECASFCAEPYAAKESVLGTITTDDIRLTAMHPDQRCTVASVASHAMYERRNPFYEYVLGGRLDMSSCEYVQLDERTCRVTGASFRADDELAVKLEGAGVVGARYFGVAGIRDPYTIAHLAEVIAWAKEQVVAEFGESGYELFFHEYGKNAVMGPHEPEHEAGHEMAILVEAVAATEHAAEAICLTATRQLFYARLPEVKGTAGSVAFPFDEVLRASPACRWTLNHVMRVEDPLTLFPRKMIDVGADRPLQSAGR